MAWKFVGFFQSELYGPLPHKRWVSSPHDKPHKMNYKAPRKISRADFRPTRESYALKAREYCRWLAQRDGIKLPDDKREHVVWHGKHIFGVYFGDVFVEIPNWNFEPAPAAEETIRPGDGLVDWLNTALAA